MGLRLDKWYLDFQSGARFGYYYLSAVSFGPWKFLWSEIHERNGALQVEIARPGRTQVMGPHGMGGSGFDLTVHPQRVRLSVDRPQLQFDGIWRYPDGPLPRQCKPLLSTPQGTCDWKVWSPCAAAEVRLNGTVAAGRGYIDFVRFALPVRHTPLRTVRWGRVFGTDGWLVLLDVETRAERVSMAHDGTRWLNNVTSTVARNSNDEISEFRWQVNGGAVNLRVERELERGAIFSAGRLGNWFPAVVRRRLDGWGFEEKYFVRGHFNGAVYAGPMEEVRWS